MDGAYPGDIVPNSELRAKRREKRSFDERLHTSGEKTDGPTSGNTATNSSSNSNSNNITLALSSSSPVTTNNNKLKQETELDLVHGYAILKYAYDHYSFDGPTVSGNIGGGGGGGGENDIGGGNDDGGYLSYFGLGGWTRSKKTELGILEKRKRLACLDQTKENVKSISRDFLMRHGITLEILIGKCCVPVTDLINAGIITSFNDLCDLSYRHKNLTINRELFNVGHMVQCFKMNADTLQLDISDIILCQFTPAELESLEISLPGWIEEGAVRHQHFCQLRYSPQVLGFLGVRGVHLRKLGITRDLACGPKMRWTSKDFDDLNK